MYGSVTVATSGQILPCVYGTVASAFSPIPYTLVITLFKPQIFDWNDFKKEKLAFETLDTVGTDPIVDEVQSRDVESAATQQKLQRWVRIAAFWSIATFLGHWVLWPLPMYGSKYIFSKTFFNAWLVVAIIWIWGTLLVAGFFPLIGGYHQFRAVWAGLRRGRHGLFESESTPDSPAEKNSTSATSTLVEPVEVKEIKE